MLLSGNQTASNLTGFLDSVASKLSADGFSVQRRVQANQYSLDILASRTTQGMLRVGAEVPYSNVVGLCSTPISDSDGVQLYSSSMGKYVRENRKSLKARRGNLSTIAAIVSPSFPDSTKRWVAQTPPSWSILSGRAEFPLLIELDTRQLTYYNQTHFQIGNPDPLYKLLRNSRDKWFGF